MTVEWGLLIALATGLLCGWLARWQYDRDWEAPATEDEIAMVSDLAAWRRRIP